MFIWKDQKIQENLDFKGNLVFLVTFSGTDFTRQMIQHSGVYVFYFFVRCVR